ncbi:MAG TPA: PTS system fructose subfamily transporter subunit IIA [Candidatus Limosilactobacillus merdigallinarum]|jgi:PTS system mannose-specific IIA component|uniref:PTS system fructose subfamily transporter subunit IIA n=1 Tax=Candidatus Limosilactobacillus merdigallinarum TaxID=2838652 RepID=A0A9D1VHT9_9LACO|nr:PTS system fructose subfamily transporter subunit IIA [Candidatus Limosilactobacillus merdigallinarum]
MTKRAFLVVTHGDMGVETVKSLELLMGEQKNVSALGLHEGENVDALKDKVVEVLDKNAKEYDETVVIVDLLGGSPSNVALRSLANYHELKIVTGLSMPLLINLVNFTDSEDDTVKLINDSIKVAQDGIKLIDKNFLKQA